MSLKHFSHDHPLILMKEVDTSDEGDGMLCYACHQPIVPSSPDVSAAADGTDVYICGEDCDNDGISNDDRADDDSKPDDNGTCGDDCGDSNDDGTSNDDATSDDDGEDDVDSTTNEDATSDDDDDVTCGDFYLHRKCAELQRAIQHPMHNRHPLTLQVRPHHVGKLCSCNICGREWRWFTYSCDSCDFDVCLTCAAVGDRSFWHIGHREHNLTLMQREAQFLCDACGAVAEDSSYACNSCEFWMHKTCALSPPTVDADFIHKHSLVLTYSLPDLHRNFPQKCRLCNEYLRAIYWLYYCDECTFFAHIYCIETVFISGEKAKEPQQEDMGEDDLVCFPVDSKESFIHLMIDQFAKRNFNNIINLKKGITTSGQHPQTPINHWSHKDHPLILLEELVGSEQVEEIICNGCIQLITPAAGHPFYGCIQCNFFLHKFCLQLPHRLPAGAFSRHPKHPLVLSHMKNKFHFSTCTTCGYNTNGFYYRCTTCNDIVFDIRCCFLPNRIKHKSHNHPLLHSAPSDSCCNACDSKETDEDLFKCERSCNFQIHIACALFPGIMRHRWDPHPISLIYPPFDHQGLIYCEICEDEIDTNNWLYHCHECDHSFHIGCLCPSHNMKVGDKKLVTGLHKHTITFVEKEKQEHHGPFLCSSCSRDLDSDGEFVFECVNCEELFCVYCVPSDL